jgi:hypothetical protein
MDEVLVRRWCDLCRAADGEKRVEATDRYEVLISVIGKRSGGPRQVDCCDKHTSQVQGLYDLVRKVGMPVPMRAVEDEPGCPVCGKEMQHYSVPEHLIKMHGAKAPKQPARCPDCTKSLDTPQGMILHRRRAHGYDYRQELINSIPKGRKKV